MTKYQKCMLKCCCQHFGNAHEFLLLSYSLLATYCTHAAYSMDARNTLKALCALILSETLALYKSFTYLLTYLLTSHKLQPPNIGQPAEIYTPTLPSKQETSCSKTMC